METLEEIVRKNLIQIRKSHGHSQSQLARISGILKQQNISYIERGARYPSLSHVEAYAAAYNVSPAWFLEKHTED